MRPNHPAIQAREHYQAIGHMGGISRACTTPTTRAKDLRECRDYLAAHPDAKPYDVALELHYTDEAARRIIRAVRVKACR